jgi:hypothetical protein
MKKSAVAVLLLCAIVSGAHPQKKNKEWTEWSKKEAQKILDDSAWGKTQVETDTSEMFYSPTTAAQTGSSSRRGAQGATNEEVFVKFHICFLSAKPVRQAFARMIELEQQRSDAKLTERLRAFAGQHSDEWIVVAVTVESNDQRFSAPVMQAFNSSNTAALRNTTYLETKDGRRLFLKQYMAPTSDGMGAKFVFARTENGQPFLNAESGEVRFYSEFPNQFKLDTRFKLSEMIYDGQLEY